MPTLKLELVDQDGRAICRGQAFVWLIDSVDGSRWGGEFFQIEQPATLREAGLTWIRTPEGETYRVQAEPCEDRSSGAAHIVSLRFRGREERCPVRRGGRADLGRRSRA